MAEYQLAEYFEFPFQARRISGALADADALPTWRAYAEGTDTVIATGDCTKRDDGNTLGYYIARGQITSPTFVEGTLYHVRVVAAFDGVSTAENVGTFLVVTADVVREDDTVALDTYQAKVWLQDDDLAATPADRYVACWYKNSQPITTGITLPLLQVVKVADGTDLVAEVAMTQIGALGLYTYTVTTAGSRIADGAAYIAKISATIGGSVRTWYQPVGRDS